MIGIAIANSIGSASYGGSVVVVPTATAATSVGSTSFTANWNAFSGANYYLLDVSLSSSFSTFVLQDTVVLTTSYNVTGLTSNTTYYYRVRAVTGSDSDAMAFVSRVYVAGGALSYNEVNATNQLVLDLKSYSIWTKMKAIYPMVGASAAACAQNLVSSSFTGTFNGGVTYASTGITGNGTSGFMNTTLSPNGNIGLNSNHLAYYSRTNNLRDQVEMGIFDTSSIYILMRCYFGIYHANNSPETNANMTDYTDSRGFFINNRVISTGMSLFRNNVKQTDNSMNSVSLSNTSIYILGQNQGNTLRLPSNRECAFASIGDKTPSGQKPLSNPNPRDVM